MHSSPLGMEGEKEEIKHHPPTHGGGGEEGEEEEYSYISTYLEIPARGSAIK